MSNDNPSPKRSRAQAQAYIRRMEAGYHARQRRTTALALGLIVCLNMLILIGVMIFAG